MADRLGIESIDREGQVVAIKFASRQSSPESGPGRPDSSGKRLNVERLLKVVGTRPDTTLVPPSTIKLDLRAGSKNTAQKPAVAAPPSAVGTKVKARQSTGQSWWTSSRNRRRSHGRLHEGGDPPAAERGPQRPRRGIRKGPRFVGRTGRATIEDRQVGDEEFGIGNEERSRRPLPWPVRDGPERPRFSNRSSSR